MSRAAKVTTGGPRGVVQLTLKEYVDDQVDQTRRELSAKIDGLNAKIDGAVIGLNAKIDGVSAKLDGMSAKLDGMSAKMDAVLQFVGPLFEGQRQLRLEVDAIKEMLSTKGPIGLRQEPPKA